MLKIKRLPAILLGRDLIRLGMKPSNKFSFILESAYDAQLHGKFSSLDEATLWLNNFLSNQ